MSKLISGLIFMYIIITVLTTALNGGGGLNTTYLTSNTSTDTIYVASTSGYLDADYIIIDGEKIAYTGKTDTAFTGCTFEKSHLANAKVYSPSTSLLNNALGFNVGAITSSVGLFAVVTIPVTFCTVTLPNLVTGQLMPGLDGTLALFGYLWLAFTIGAVISIGVAMLWVASGIVK